MTTLQFMGEAGKIDYDIDWPTRTPKGWALVLHPHPLFSGTRENKVVTTIARACVQQDLVAVRPNFRGVGQSSGLFDHGKGETADMLRLVTQLRTQMPELAAMPWMLAGFSFGTAVAAQLYGMLADIQVEPLPSGLIFAGAAIGRFQFREVQLPGHALFVHGESDEIVPLNEVLDWLRPRALPVTVLPGASHFFHGQLTLLKQLVLTHLKALL